MQKISKLSRYWVDFFSFMLRLWRIDWMCTFFQHFFVEYYSAQEPESRIMWMNFITASSLSTSSLSSSIHGIDAHSKSFEHTFCTMKLLRSPCQFRSNSTVEIHSTNDLLNKKKTKCCIASSNQFYHWNSQFRRIKYGSSHCVIFYKFSIEKCT